MKSTSVLALAVAVLPAANAARTPFCYRKFTCYKAVAGASLSGDNSKSGTTYTSPTAGTTVTNAATATAPTTSSLGKCKGEANSTFVNSKGVFSATGGIDDVWIDAKADKTDTEVKEACLIKFTEADGKLPTPAETGKPDSTEIGTKTPVVAIGSKTYKDKACTTELSADYSAQISSDSSTKKLYGGPVPAGGDDTSSEEIGVSTVAHLTAAVGDRVISPGGHASFRALLNGLFHRLGTTYAGVPTITGSNWDGKYYSGSTLTTETAAKNVQDKPCLEFLPALKTAINGDKNLSDTSSSRVPYALAAETKADSKINTLYKAASGASDPVPDRSPGAVSAHCDASGDLAFKYHAGANCAAAALGTTHWSPTNAVAGILKCHPLPIRHADCEGVDACVDAVDVLLKHITDETGASKACGTATADPNVACSKDCICGNDTASKAASAQLNWAVATVDTKVDATCWLSADAPGQYNISLSATTSVTNGVFTYTAPTATNGVYKTTIDQLFTQTGGYNANLNSAAETAITFNAAGQYGCGRIDKTHTADAKVAGYDAAHDGLWGAKGCGYKATAGGNGGATSNFVVSGFTVVAGLLAAALL